MTHIHFIGWAAVCASVIAFKLIYERVKRDSARKRFLWWLFFSILSVPSMLSTIYYLHIFPEWAWFYELRSWRGSEFLAIALGASGGCLATFLPRIAVPIILLGSTLIATVPYLKPIFSPLHEEEISNKFEDGVCLQSAGFTCGPASITTILRSLGVQTSERDVACHAFTCQSGTESWYLARYVRSRGLKAHFDFRPGLPDDLKIPAMIGVSFGVCGHFIPVLSKDGTRITIADPLSGVESMEMEKFTHRYHLTGFHLSISKD